MTPKEYGEMKTLEILLMYLLRDFLEREKDPERIVEHMREHLVSVEGIDHPEARQAAFDLFEFVIGPTLNNVRGRRNTDSSE